MIEKLKHLRFRCHALGHIMTDPKSGGGLSETAKDYLIQRWVEAKYHRYKDISRMAAVEKGLHVEEDAITQYLLVQGFTWGKKNEDNYSNGFLTGTPDIILPDNGLVVDTKSSWDIFTFMNTRMDAKVDKFNYWQVQGYMALLPDIDTAHVAYELINTPDHLLQRQKNVLKWQMDVIDPDAHPEYLEACKEIDRLGTYDDIPMNEKHFVKVVERNQEDIDRIYNRVELCRAWMMQTFCPGEILDEQLRASIELLLNPPKPIKEIPVNKKIKIRI